MDQIGILIEDDHKPMRMGLVSLFNVLRDMAKAIAADDVTRCPVRPS